MSSSSKQQTPPPPPTPPPKRLRLLSLPSINEDDEEGEEESTSITSSSEVVIITPTIPIRGLINIDHRGQGKFIANTTIPVGVKVMPSYTPILKTIVENDEEMQIDDN